jgi:NitT/TauT family transport system permease protein
MKALGAFIAGLALLLGWEAAVRLLNVDPFVLPAPSAVALSLAQNAGSLLEAAWATLKVTWTALGLAVVSGVGLALAVARSRLAAAGVLPLAIALQATPVVAIAPLILIWTGVEQPERALVIVAWICAFFPVLSTMLSGLAAVPPDLRDLFRLYKAGGWATFRRLELPACLPALVGGVKVAAGLALIGAVVAEFVVGSGGSQGLAWRLIEAQYRLDIPKLFACLMLLSVIGIAHYAALGWVEQRVLKARGVLR